MEDTLASVERSVAVEFALVEVQRVLRQWGTLTHEVVSPAFARQISAQLRAPNGASVHSRGKGPFPQNLASGFFEILEHAVSMGVVPHEDCRELRLVEDLYGKWELPVDYLGRLFKGHRDREVPASPFMLLSNPAEQQTIWLPSAVYDENPLAGEQTYLEEVAARYWSSNGFGAGMTVADASLHALNEVVERDAFSQFLLDAGHGRAAGVPVELSGQRLRQLGASVSASTQSSIELRLISALAGYVVIAAGTRHDYHGRRLVGLGSSISASYAVERALLEYEQECALESEFDSGTRAVDEDDIGHSEWIAHYPFLDRCFRLTRLPPAAGESVQVLDDSPARWSRADVELDRQVTAIAACGYPVLRRILFRRPSGTGVVAPTVVQVVVLGAEKFHLVRSAVPVEPVGRLRDARTVELCRQVAGRNACSDGPKSSVRQAK